MSKAIYQPKGKAKEYNQWAVNFYNGCSGKCTYCFNRKGLMANVLGKDEPTIKKSIIDEKTALIIFEKEVKKYLPHLREHGLFFNFVSDPFLPETTLVNQLAMRHCFTKLIPVIALTKQTHWVEALVNEIKSNGTIWNMNHDFDFTAGFTLTGHDELEPGCATNYGRIQAMKELHKMGIRTWASIEPVIDFKSSLEMIRETIDFCDHYKIGLESGKKYDKADLSYFVSSLQGFYFPRSKATVYWKDSITNKLFEPNDYKNIWTSEWCVDADYKFWKK